MAKKDDIKQVDSICKKYKMTDEERWEFVDRLIGKKCWQVNFTYGGEVCLHFGRRLSYDSPLMKGKKRGEWQLRTRGTTWEVFAPTGSFSSTEGSEAALEHKRRHPERRRA